MKDQDRKYSCSCSGVHNIRAAEYLFTITLLVFHEKVIYPSGCGRLESQRLFIKARKAFVRY